MMPHTARRALTSSVLTPRLPVNIRLTLVLDQPSRPATSVPVMSFALAALDNASPSSRDRTVGS